MPLNSVVPVSALQRVAALFRADRNRRFHPWVRQITPVPTSEDRRLPGSSVVLPAHGAAESTARMKVFVSFHGVDYPYRHPNPGGCLRVPFQCVYGHCGIKGGL